MNTVTLYSAQGCHLCEQALVVLRRVQRRIPFELVECDIDDDESLRSAYFDRVPVVALDGEELCDCVVDEQLLCEALSAARR